MIRLTKILFPLSFQVIVIGGGHAGCEAASAAARLGSNTCLITQNKDTIGEMSCNPSMGGVGKGHLIREVDALGGLIAKISDKSATHYRMLNQSKGYSAQGLRALIDRDLYRQNMFETLLKTPNLSIIEGSVEDFLLDGNQGTIRAVKLNNGQEIRGQQIILTTGTFLRGMIHIGNVSYPAGRHRRNSEEVEPPSIGLSETIEDTLGFRLGRYKTGTPPRLLRKTIDFSCLPVQKSQDQLWFSFSNEFNRVPYPNPFLDSYITQTNERSHSIVQKYKHLLPEYQKGELGYGVGPRYCPSIESKLKKFPEKKFHHIFLEFEGLNSQVVFPTGLSTGLPQEAQIQLIRSIEGLEQAEIVRPGYAIEYDFVDPKQLLPTLQTEKVKNLYLAGQINGTTGYEEAAAQGIIAGINAGLSSTNRDPFIPSRLNSMIGVLINDIIGIGVTEPYRMLTTRSQHRLLQRYDNADERLSPDAIRMGLVSQQQTWAFQLKKELISEGVKKLQAFSLSMSDWKKHIPEKVKEDAPVNKSAADLVSQHHNVFTEDISSLVPVDSRVFLNLNVILKYRIVLEKERQKAQRITRELLQTKLDLEVLRSCEKQIVAEDFQKLMSEQPKNLYLASRIRGIRDTTIHTLAFLGRKMEKEVLIE